MRTPEERALDTARELAARQAVADLIKDWPGVNHPNAAAAVLVRAAFTAAAKVRQP